MTPDFYDKFWLKKLRELQFIEAASASSKYQVSSLDEKNAQKIAGKK